MDSVVDIAPEEDALCEVRKLVSDWLGEEDREEFESKLNGILEEIAKTPSPVHLHQVLAILPDISSLVARTTDCMPLMNWPWLHPSQPLTSDVPQEHAPTDFGFLEKDRNLYRAIADILSKTRGRDFYARGNGLRLFSTTNTEPVDGAALADSTYRTAYLCRDKEFLEEAPQRHKILQWYSGGEDGQLRMHGIKLAVARVEGDFEGQWQHKRSTPEFVPLCAVGRNRKEVESLSISVAMSVLLVQAVSISQDVRGSRYPRVHMQSKNLFQYGNKTLIGSQIALLAAVYSELSSPRTSLNLAKSNRYEPLSLTFVTIASGLDMIPAETLANNMYWVHGLGVDNAVPERKPKFKIIGIENALYRRDLKRPFKWFLVISVTIALILVSVLYQSEVGCAEKLEKILNLIFTIAVATFIGLAGVHPDKNWLTDVRLGRRLISVADETSEELFADVMDFLMQQGDDAGKFVSSKNSSWVAPDRYGATKIGRAVHLNELEGSYLSVNRRYHMCLVKVRGPASVSARKILFHESGRASIAASNLETSGVTGERAVKLHSMLRLI